jgi:Beta-lactamase class C and other penicillin binding proteins
MNFEKVRTPEEAGVNSAVVLEFLKLLDDYDTENHSFIILKDGKIALEHYAAPFNSSYKHECFSVSKGLISTAVGFAINEGKMTLDTPILDYYPEYIKYIKKDPRNGEITVRDLLLMSSGKKVKFIKDMTKGSYSDDWIKYKFRNKKDFMYSNDDVYMLAKAITRIYGMSVLDMLEPRLFAPLDIQKPFWETTNEGIEAGATGLYIRPMDLAKISYCYVCGGKWDGKQVIPEEWTKIAGGYYVDLPPYYNTSKKYGYYFWGDPNGDYRFDGMYGQWAIIFKEFNAVVVFNNSSCKVQAIIDEMWKYFPRAFTEQSDGSKTQELADRLADKSRFEVPKASRSTIEENVQGKYKFHKFKVLDVVNYPISMLPLVISGTMPQKAIGSFNDLEIKFDKDSLYMTWSEGKERNTVQIGLNGELKESIVTLGTFRYPMLSYGVWLNTNTLFVEVRPIETASKRVMKLTFKRNKVKINLLLCLPSANSPLVILAKCP